MMDIVIAKPEDYPRVRLFYHSLIDAIQKSEYRPGWQKDIYPDPKELQNEIEAGCLFCGMLQGEIAATMVVNHKFNEEYEKAHWKIKALPEELLVIHMLGVHPDHFRKGLAKEMVRFVLEMAKESKMKTVRLDVLKGNLPAERLYPELGFSYVETLSMFYEDVGWQDFELFEIEV